MGTIYADCRLGLGGLAGDAAIAKGILGDVQGGVGGLGSMMPGVGTIIAGSIAIAGAAIIGLGIKTTKMAGDFQAGMTSLVTGAGESQNAIGMVSNGILNMAVSTGTSTQQLIAGMFNIESAGYHGADGLNILKIAAEGAKVGNADLGDTSNALLTILANYGPTGTTASQAMNTLTAIVSNGRTHMQDLASSISTVLPTAAKFGVSLTDVSGALADMTMQNGDAATSTTYLRQLISSLASPTTASKKALADIGLTAQEVSDDMKKSLPDTLQMITDHINSTFPPGSVAANDAFKAIAGGAKQMQGMLLLTGAGMAGFKSDVEAVTKSVQAGGQGVTGWSKVQNDFNFKVDRAKEVVETLGIKIGTALLPVAGNLVTLFADGLVTVLLGVVDGFQNVVTGVQNLWGALQPLRDVIGDVANAISLIWPAPLAGLAAAFIYLNAGAIGELLVSLPTLVANFISLAVDGVAGFIASIPEMVAGFLASAGAAWTMAAGVIAATWPLIAIVAGVTLVVIAIKLLITHWTQVSEFLQTVWKAISGFATKIWGDIATFFTGLWNGITSGIKTAWNAITGFFTNTFNVIKATVQSFVTAIVGFFAWLYNHNYYFKDLVDFIVGVFTWLKSTATTIWNDIVGFFVQCWTNIKNNTMTAWNDITGFLAMIWQGIQKAATTAWNLVKQYIIGPIQDAWGKIQQVAGWIVSTLEGTWNTVKGDVSTAWTNFVGSITGAIANVSTEIGKVSAAITTPIGNLVATLKKAGADAIQGLIDGITSMASAVGNAAGNIAGKITGALGFHKGSLIPPKEGPASDADQWMPALMGGIVEDINAGTPGVMRAAGGVAAALQGALAGNGANLGALGLNGAQLASTGIAAKGGDTYIINAPVTVTADQNDSGTPEQVGQQFGNAFGTQLALVMQQRGH